MHWQLIAVLRLEAKKNNSESLSTEPFIFESYGKCRKFRYAVVGAITDPALNYCYKGHLLYSSRYIFVPLL